MMWSVASIQISEVSAPDFSGGTSSVTRCRCSDSIAPGGHAASARFSLCAPLRERHGLRLDKLVNDTQSRDQVCEEKRRR
jgi:hypothetical protein